MSGIVKTGGTVTYNKQPLANVNVTFHPENGRPASGKTDASGRFVLTTLQSNDGAVLGRHKVSISTSAAPPMRRSAESKWAEPLDTVFPVKFSNPKTSGLTAVVEPGSSNDFTFELSD